MSDCFPPTPRKQYPSVRQKAKLFDLLEADIELKRGKFSRTFTRTVATERWRRIGAQLNAIPGATKTYEEWRKTWQDIKSKAKKRQAEINAANMPAVRDRRRSTDNEYEQLVSNESKPKKGNNIIFTTVKQACVDLVKKHGHSVTLFDAEAFRSILQLLPMTMKEMTKITSEYIQKYVDMNEGDDETATNFQDDRDASDMEEANEPIISITIKGETYDESQCTCGARVSEDIIKGHDLGCPAASMQPYWNYFKVTTDEATCQICGDTLTWSNITKMKEHLVEKHPTAEYVDDDAEFARGPGSDVWSHDETEDNDLYPEDDFDGDPQPSTTKKRRRTSDQPKSEGDPSKNSKGERKDTKQIKTESGTHKPSKRVISITLERLKCLDSFGRYVGALMKLIPNEKSLKLQVQIVQRLLREQAAAG